MIYWNYMNKMLREHLSFILFAWIMVGIFQLLMIALVVEADILGMAQVFFKKFPPMMQQFVGEEVLAQFSIAGAIAFGYNHPIVIIVLALMAITLPAKHIAGEIETGTMELMLSLPVSRIKLAASLWFFSAIIFLVIIAGGWAGSFLGVILYPQMNEIPFQRIVLVGIHLWLLMLVINASAFFVSVYSKERSKVAQRVAGLILFFYFLNYAAKFWSAIGFFKYATIFYYFQPQELMIGKTNGWANAGIFLALTLVLMIFSLQKMKNRDIPG